MSRTNLPRPALYALLIAGLLAVAAVGYLLVISPRRSESARLDSELVAVEQAIATHRLALRAAATRDPRDQFGRLVRLSKALPEVSDPASVLVELNHLASASGVEFESIAPQPAVAGTGFHVIPIDIVVEGGYADVSRFLGRLRSQVAAGDGRLRATGRLYSVDHIELTEGTQKFPDVKASIKLNAFRYTAVAAAAAPPTTTTPSPEGSQAASVTP